MIMPLLALLVAATACAGFAAARADVRRQSWKLALYGMAGFLLVYVALIGLVTNMQGGSFWHTILLWPAIASFAGVYIISRLISVARS